MGLETLEQFNNELELRKNEVDFDANQFAVDWNRGLDTSGRNRVQPESAKSLKSKGFFRETGEALAGGIADTGTLWMRAVRALDPEGGNDIIRDFATGGINAIQNFISRHPSLSPDNQVQEGVKRWWVEGVRALVPSLSASIPGIIVGGLAGNLPGAAVGGAALSGAIFGLAEFDTFHEEVETFITENQLSEEEAANLREEARNPAIFSALTEGGLEAAANALQIRTLGRFIPGRTALKNIATQPIRELFKKSAGQIAKETAKTLAITTPVEVGTEFTQAALETKFRRDIGLTDTDSIEAGFRAMGPAFVMNLLFFGAGRGANAFQRHSIRKSLQEAGTGKNRERAVKDIADIVRGMGQPESEAIAATLEASGKRFIEEGIPINLDTQIGLQHFFNEYLEGMQRGEITLKQSEELVSKVQDDLDSGQLSGQALRQTTQIAQVVSTINDRIKVSGVLQKKEKRKKRPATAIEKLVGLGNAAVDGTVGTEKEIGTVTEIVEDKVKDAPEALREVAEEVTKPEAVVAEKGDIIEKPEAEITREEGEAVVEAKAPEEAKAEVPVEKAVPTEEVKEVEAKVTEKPLADIPLEELGKKFSVAVERGEDTTALEAELDRLDRAEKEGAAEAKPTEPLLQVAQLEDINITESPVNKLEAPVQNAVKEEARLIEEEIKEAVAGENLVEKDEFGVTVKVTKQGIPSTFPPYFAGLKGGKRAILNALTKIIQGKGDTGVMVNRLKDLIQARLQGKQSRFQPGSGQVEPTRSNRFIEVEEAEVVIGEVARVAEEKITPDFKTLSESSDEIQDKIEILRDKVEKEQGIKDITKQEEASPELKEAQDEMIRLDTAIAQKAFSGAQNILETILGFTDKDFNSLSASIKGVLGDIGLFDKPNTGAFFFNRDTIPFVNEKIPDSIVESMTDIIFSKENPSADFQTTFDTPFAGITKKGKLVYLERGKELASEFQTKLSDLLLDKEIATQLDPVAQAKKNLTDKMGRLGIGVDPTILKDMVIVGSHHFNSGLKTFKSWSGAMITDLGKSIKGLLRRIWRAVRKQTREGKAVVDESTAYQKQAVTAEEKQTTDKAAQVDQIDAVKKTTEFIKSDQADKQPDLIDQFNNFITHNAGNVLINDESKGNIEDMFSDIKKEDISWVGRMFNLPWQKAKKFVEWQRTLGIEIGRSQNKHLFMIEFGRKVFKRSEVKEGTKADVHEFIALKDKQSIDKVSAILLEGDARRKEFTDKQLKDGITTEELDKITDEYKEFADPIKLTQEEITAYRAWQVTMKRVRRKMIEANENMLFKPFQGEKWIGQLKKVVRKNSSKIAPEQVEFTLAGQKKEEPKPVIPKLVTTDLEGLSDAEQKAFIKAYNQIVAPHNGIQELRRQMGELRGYVPHLREEGTIKISFVDKAGQVQDSTILRNRKEAQAYITERTAFHKRKGNDYTLLKPETVARTPEFLYQEVSAAALERFSNKAFDRFKLSKEGKEPGKITSEDLEGIREGMRQALADELSARGFGERTLKRARETNIAGYRVTNLKDILHGYISGSSGFMTKMDAAYQQGQLLGEIDVKTKPNLYEEISIYSRNMMRNLTRADQISSKIRTFAFMWYLSGQLKSPAVNFTQNYILGIPELAKFTKGATRKYHKAMLDISTGRLTDLERKALLEVQKRGDTGDQLMQEIFGQTNLNTHKSLHKLIKILSFPFSYSEILNRKFAFLARFRAGIEKGETFEQAKEAGTKFIFDVHFLYGKLNQPIISTGGTPFSNIVRTSLTFRMYTFSYMNSMKNHIGNRNFALVGRSMAYMALLGGLSSLPFLDDFLDMWERFTGIPIRKKIQQELKGIGGDVLAVVGTQGLPALLGIDLSGSLRIHLPDPTDPARLFEESVFGVYEGLAVKAKDSFQSILDGEPLRALEQAAPIFIEKPLKAWRVSRDGRVTTKTGKTIFTDTGKVLKLSGLEAVVQSLGFRPAKLAFESGKFRQFTNVESNFQKRRVAIFRRLRFAKTREDRRDVFKSIREYNTAARKLRGAVPLITSKSLQATQKERPSKRFRAFSRS